VTPERRGRSEHSLVMTRALVTLLAVLTVVAAGCGREGRPDEPAAGGDQDGQTGAFEEGLSGRIRVDGSSTVGPLTTFAAEQFRNDEPGVRITVGVSGTGGGFERFCAGETDISNASRPIEPEEEAACKDEGIEYVELQIANDALSVVVNPDNDWADCLTVSALKRIWQPRSQVDSWRDVDPDFPDERLSLFGPGTDSGTFDYFTEAIVGEEGKSRSDYSATEDDNVIVRGVAGEKGGLGYFGFSYLEQNRDRLKALEIDGGNGCVAPSLRTVQDGSYRPLARPLLVYVKQASLERLEVEAFVQYLLDNERQIAEKALFVPLTAAQLERAQSRLDEAALGLG
jgi:phosphate transport system substrate-binding protein